MKRLLITALAAGVSFSTFAMPAAAADFSGTWVRDQAQSSAAGYPVYWMTRATQQMGGGNNAPYLMEVRQDSAAVQASDPVHPARKYVLDGKPHQVRTDSMLAQASVTAALVGDTLSVVTAQPYGGMPGNVATREVQTWSMSADGKVLTVLLQRESPAARQSYKEVFTKR
jgi:hypothetical protein